MKVTHTYYCRPCLELFREGRCPSCNGTLNRELEPAEEIHKRAILSVLRNHKAEFIHALEVEKADDD